MILIRVTSLCGSDGSDGYICLPWNQAFVPQASLAWPIASTDQTVVQARCENKKGVPSWIRFEQKRIETNVFFNVEPRLIQHSKTIFFAGHGEQNTTKRPLTMLNVDC